MTVTNATATLESTDFSQGRIALNNNTQTIHYHHRDHLGSVRAITNGSGTVIEQNSYYPFGGRHNFGISNTPAANNRYKFNGKEEQTIVNLDLLDYGARMYDTKIARWLVQDQLAEKYYAFSAYNYCVNNPVMFMDPDGRDVWEIDGQGRIINRIKDKIQDAFYIVEKDSEGIYQRVFSTDENGNKVYKSISFNYGTIGSQRNITYSSDKKTTDSIDIKYGEMIME